MASLAGVTYHTCPTTGVLLGTMNRCTGRRGAGLFTLGYVEREGEFCIANARKNTGVCRQGKHGGSAVMCHHYHGTRTGKELWSVTFRAKDIMATDGQKVRVRAGVVRKVANKMPWYK